MLRLQRFSTVLLAIWLQQVHCESAPATSSHKGLLPAADDPSAVIRQDKVSHYTAPANVNHLTDSSLSCADIESINCTALPSNLGSLVVTGCDRLQPSMFARCAAFSSLRKLAFLAGDEGNNTFNELPVKAFLGLTNLEQLVVDVHAMWQNGSFDGLPNLERLYLRPPKAGIETLPACGFSGLNSLIGLYITPGDVRRLEAEAFRGLRFLEVLSITSGHMERIEPGAFSLVRNVQSLELRGNSITQLTHGVFDGLEFLLSLRISCNNISSIEPGVFNSTPALQLLDLSFNKLTVWQSSLVASFPRELQVIDVCNNPIADVEELIPNRAGPSTYVNLKNTLLTSPHHFNALAVRGPVFALPNNVNVRCESIMTNEIRDEKPTVTTSCSCETNYALRNGRCKDQTMVYIAAGSGGGIGLGLLVGALIAFVIVRSRRRSARLRKEVEMREHLLSQAEQDNDTLKLAWQIDAAELDLLEKLDAGAYGEVWRADWGMLPVAAKILHRNVAAMHESAQEEFLKEVSFLMRCRHPNIVRFLGAGERDGLPFMVTEYMERGSLKDYLRDESKPLDWVMRLSFAEDIAKGLAYIHGLGKMHRDVKTGNVLLDARMRCKIIDFGTVREICACRAPVPVVGEGNTSSSSNSRSQGNLGQNNVHCDVVSVRAGKGASDGRRAAVAVAGSNNSTASPSSSRGNSLDTSSREPPSRGSSPAMTVARGTPLYMAPEVLHGSSYSFAADIFSYAVVLWEIGTRRSPDVLRELGLDRAGGSYLIRLSNMLDEGKRLPLNTEDTHDWPVPYVQLIEEGWQENPSRRPSFKQIWTALQRMSVHN